MTLFRMVVILGGGLLLLLAVVILRAETTRIQHEIAGCERDAEELRQQLRDTEFELARLRNPMRIRERLADAASQFAEDEPPAPPPEPTRRRRSGR